MHTFFLLVYTPVSTLYDTCIRCFLLVYILQNFVSLYKRQHGLRWTITSLVKCISFLECLESQSFLVVSLWMVASLCRRCSCLLSDTDLDVLQRTLFVSKCSIHQIPSVPIVDCYHKIRQQVKCYLQMSGSMGKNELQEVRYIAYIKWYSWSKITSSPRVPSVSTAI